MDYQQFVNAIEERIRQNVKEGMAVIVHTMMKNNGKKRVGLTITEQGINASPTIYLEEYFEQFQKNQSLDNIVKQIWELYEKVRVERSWNIGMLQEYEKVKEKIVYKLVNREKNKQLLESIPYIPYLDLAIVFYVLFDVQETGTATLLISNDILKIWGVSKTCIYEDAKNNTKKVLFPEFRTMSSIVAEMLEEVELAEEEDFLYVLTNHLRSFGAACILYESMLADIGIELGENFYVLPSSIHEVIIVPESKVTGRAALEEMVQEINVTQVEEEEVLSSHVYYYIRTENRLIL